MTRDYELMYVVRPELDDEGLRAAVRSVRALIESNGGEIVKTTIWGKRRLAYEVDRMRDGQYVLLALRLDTARLAPVERALRIHDSVFRHLLVRYEGEMPPPDGEVEDVSPPLEPAAPADEGVTVSALEEETAEDDDELSVAPPAIEDEEEES